MKTILTLLLLAYLVEPARAQDTIRLIDGTFVLARIREVSPYEVSYLRYRAPGARPVAGHASNSYANLKISASRISELVYAGGQRDSILPVPKTAGDTGKRYFSGDDYYRLGANDALLHYRGYRTAAASTFLCTFPGSPALGLLVAIGTSVTAPVPQKFTYPNEALLTNDAYARGYAKKAHSIKAGKVWANWGVGTLLTGLTLLIISRR